MGESYDRKLQKINESLVFTRPKEDLHSVAEIYSHISFWRVEAILKIRTGKGSKTEEDEGNWLSNEELEKKGWPRIKSEYDSSLSELIDLLRGKDDSFLDEEYYDTDFIGTYKYSFLINGILHHDIYHLGQLGIIVKYLLAKSST